MTKEKIKAAWEILKHEISREQFDSLTYWAQRLRKYGWRLDDTKRGKGNSIILVLRDNSPRHHRHWFGISENGEACFMPTFMDVR